MAQSHLKHGLSTSDIIPKAFKTFRGCQNTGQKLEKNYGVMRYVTFLNSISC